MRTISASTGMLLALLLCASAPCARAAGRKLAQSYTPCITTADYGPIADRVELSVPAQTRSFTEMGSILTGDFFVIATSQDSSAFGVDIFYGDCGGGGSGTNGPCQITGTGQNSDRNDFGLTGCYVSDILAQCPYTGRVMVQTYCKNTNSPCPMLLDLYTTGSCFSTAPALAPATSVLDQGSSEPAIDPVNEAPSQPDVLTPVPEPELNNAPSSPSDSNDSSSSGTSIGVIVGAAVGGVVLLAVFGGLIFWCYRRRQRRARSNAEHDLGIGDFVMDKAVEHVTKEEEASSETSDVAVEF